MHVDDIRAEIMMKMTIQIVHNSTVPVGFDFIFTKSEVFKHFLCLCMT